MAYYNDDFIKHRRKQWLRSLVYVEAEVSGKWYRGTINKKEIEGDTLVIIATFPQLDSMACTITATRLIDIRGEEAAYKSRKITKLSDQGTMIKITTPIYEVTA